MDVIASAGTLDSSAPYTADASARHERLVHAAQQFEAVMLGEMMKPLATNGAIGEDAESGQSNSMQSFGVESMAGALARSGALGFAKRMVAAVEKTSLEGAKNNG